MNHGSHVAQSQGFPFQLAIVASATLLAAAGCDQGYTSANGDLGNILYRMSCDHHTSSDDLREVHIVTGHEQYIGELIVSDLADNYLPPPFQHVLDPAMGTIRGNDLGFYVNVYEPGTYLVQTYQEGELLDQIPLVFERPSSLELVTWVYSASVDGFIYVPTGETTVVTDGTQATFLSVPLGANGTRLAGDIAVDCTADPPSSAAFTVAVNDVSEDDISFDDSELSVVFTKPGLVTITCTDTANGASGSHVFDVQPLP